MIKTLNTESILSRFDAEIGKKIGQADVEAQRQEALDFMQERIMKARARKVTIEDICDVAKGVAKENGVELTDAMIRASLSKWEKRKPKKRREKAAMKATGIKKAAHGVIPTPARTSLFDGQ